MAKREWSTERVDEEWWGERTEALTTELAARLSKLRNFITPEKMLAAVSSGLAYDEPGRRWVLPCRDIKGDIRFAKAWRIPPPNTEIPKWVTVGRRLLRGETGAIGRLWDTPWLVDHLDKHEGKTLWICAGEWDVIMLRCAGMAATCWTDGETSAIKASQIMEELGGEESTKAILGSFQRVAIVFDCDEAGRRGSKLWYNVLSALIKKLEVEIDVVAVDLRKAPGFYEMGQLEGWDVSDFIVWSRAHKNDKDLKTRIGPNWLIDSVSGVIDGLLDVKRIELTDVLRPAESGGKYNFRTSDVPELVSNGVQYALAVGSRGEGAYHMGYKASRSGWDYNSLVEAGGAEAFKAAVDLQMPKADDYPISEVLGHFKRSLMDYASPEVLDTDLANVFRFHHYFPFLMIHPQQGWMWWSGTHWEHTDTGAHDHAVRIASKISEEADEQFALGNDTLAIRLKKWAKRSQSASAINNITSQAEKMSIFRPNGKMGEEWDSQPTMLATPEGVVDLEHPYGDDGKLIVKTGLEARNLFLSQTTRGKLSSRHAGSVETARSFVERVMRQWHSDDEVLNTLQELAGWNLIGRNPQKLIVFQSPGRSGKTAFLNAIAHSLGALASDIPASALAPNAGDSTRQSSLASNSGKRMTVIKEVGEQGLEPETLKMLAGEDEYTARKLYRDMGKVKNTTTLYCTTNVDFVETLRKQGALGEAMHGRVIVIQWLVTFVDAEQFKLAYEIEKGLVQPTDMSRERALNIVLEHKAGKVFPLDRNVGFAMSGGLIERETSGPERAHAAQSMADAWLQWAFDGWLRCLNRGGDYGFSIAPSITRETETSFDVADDIDYYFYNSDLWRADPAGGEIVCSAGLRKSIIDFLAEAEEVSLISPGVSGGNAQFSPGSANAYSTLQRLRDNVGGNALGMLLQGKRGFENVGRKTRGQMLWGTGAIQDRCWKVPFKFIGGI